MSYALKQQLANEINSQISLHDLQITSECEHQLERMISIGVEKMIIGKFADTLDKRTLAVQNLVRFLELMENKSRELGCYPILDDEAFKAVMLDGIPLWPFSSVSI